MDRASSGARCEAEVVGVVVRHPPEFCKDLEWVKPYLDTGYVPCPLLACTTRNKRGEHGKLNLCAGCAARYDEFTLDCIRTFGPEYAVDLPTTAEA